MRAFLKNYWLTMVGVVFVLVVGIPALITQLSRGASAVPSQPTSASDSASKTTVIGWRKVVRTENNLEIGMTEVTFALDPSIDSKVDLNWRKAYMSMSVGPFFRH